MYYKGKKILNVLKPVIVDYEEAIGFAESERQKSKNLINPNSIIAKRIQYDTGEIIVNSGEISINVNEEEITIGTTLTWKGGCFPYIEIEPTKDYSFSYLSDKPSAWGVSFYDENKTFISGTYKGETKQATFKTPSNAKYVSIGIDNIESGATKYSKILFCKGEDFEYVKYNGAIVHEKDIADVEHIETIYDMNDTNYQIVNGEKYTTGVPVNTSIYINGLPKKIIVYSARYRNIIRSEVDTSLFSSGAFNFSGVGLQIAGESIPYKIYQTFTFVRETSSSSYIKMVSSGYQRLSDNTYHNEDDATYSQIRKVEVVR